MSSQGVFWGRLDARFWPNRRLLSVVKIFANSRTAPKLFADLLRLSAEENIGFALFCREPKFKNAQSVKSREPGLIYLRRWPTADPCRTATIALRLLDNRQRHSARHVTWLRNRSLSRCWAKRSGFWCACENKCAALWPPMLCTLFLSSDCCSFDPTFRAISL